VSKVIAIDYGSKKVGIAISDISQKIAFGQRIYGKFALFFLNLVSEFV